MIEERRQDARFKVDSPLLVWADDAQGGYLFDIGEGGLALDGLLPVSNNDVIRLSFTLPAPNTRIDARGQLAWADESACRVGLQFVDLPEASRQNLREWIYARILSRSSEEETPALLEPREQPAQTVSFAAASAGRISRGEAPEPVHKVVADLGSALNRLKKVSEPIGRRLESHLGKAWIGFGGAEMTLERRHLTGLFVTVMVLCSAFFFLGFFMGRSHRSSPVTQVAAASEKPVPPAVTSSVSAAAPPAISATNSPLSTSPLAPEDFVLQVATRKQQRGALSLSHSLNQKNFPAFVIKDPHGPFYRVEVGPYSDADSARRDKAGLAKQGFESVLKRWPPE